MQFIGFQLKNIKYIQSVSKQQEYATTYIQILQLLEKSYFQLMTKVFCIFEANKLCLSKDVAMPGAHLDADPGIGTGAAR